MTLLYELERLGRAVAATGAVGDVEVKLPRVAFFQAVREVEQSRATMIDRRHPRIPGEAPPVSGGMDEVCVHGPSGAVRAKISEDS